MRRADRLFQLVQLIRGRRLSTAAFLAQRLEVSARTVYRDVADLQPQGVPIEGEAGSATACGAGFDLPPLMFTQDEAKALVASVRIAQPRVDAALAREAEAALSKILRCCRSAARAAAESLALYAPPRRARCRHAAAAEALRVAARGAAEGAHALPRPQGRRQRTHGAPARLLLLGRGLDAGGLVRDARRFRNFRIDRIERLERAAKSAFATSPARRSPICSARPRPNAASAPAERASRCSAARDSPKHLAAGRVSENPLRCFGR